MTHRKAAVFTVSGRFILLSTIVFWQILCVPNGKTANPGGNDSAGSRTVRVGAFLVTCDPARGGLIRSIKERRHGQTLLEAMHIYTDFGLYGPGRGYAGTREARPREWNCSLNHGRLELQAAGRLAGRPVQGRPATDYRFRAEFTPDGVLHIEAAVRPGLSKPAARGAFLALNWTIPGLVEFSAHTVKGIVRRRYLSAADLRHRAWAARTLPMAPEHPEIECMTSAGARIQIRNIRAAGDIPGINPVIHGHSVFLCWLDSTGVPVHAGSWSRLSCDVVFTPPRPESAAGGSRPGPRPAGLGNIPPAARKSGPNHGAKEKQ